MKTVKEVLADALNKYISELKGGGSYLGTEIEEKWWTRYTKNKLFMRGNGKYWHDEDGFYFHRYLTKKPIFIPFERILEVKIGKWHGGKWILGYPILKIVWMKDNLRLSSGFFVSKREEDVMMLKNILELRIRH